MGWHIQLLENTVKVSKKTAAAMFKANLYKGSDTTEIWEDRPEDVLSQYNPGKLWFNFDHSEHMDYLAWNHDLVKILCRAKVRGRILFRSTEGDNRGEYWGHEFDGRGGYTRLKGSEKVVWVPDRGKS